MSTVPVNCKAFIEWLSKTAAGVFWVAIHGVICEHYAFWVATCTFSPMQCERFPKTSQHSTHDAGPETWCHDSLFLHLQATSCGQRAAAAPLKFLKPQRQTMQSLLLHLQATNCGHVNGFLKPVNTPHMMQAQKHDIMNHYFCICRQQVVDKERQRRLWSSWSRSAKQSNHYCCICRQQTAANERQRCLWSSWSRSAKQSLDVPTICQILQAPSCSGAFEAREFIKVRSMFLSFVILVNTAQLWRRHRHN